MSKSPTSSMSIDIFKDAEDVFANENLCEIKCFMDYQKSPDASFAVDKVVIYVVLLYSKDSILNKKPMPQLKDRKNKAAILAGLNPEQTEVKELIFDLISPSIRDMISDYVLHQSDPEWTERVVVSEQLDENIRIRMKPIQNRVSTPVVKKKPKAKQEDELLDNEIDIDEANDDKYILESSEKKFKLTSHADTYRGIIKKLDAIIFADNDDVKVATVKRQRRSLESMANA